MPRYVIEYEGGCIDLTPGDTVVGRGLHCRIRFNDPAVSRRHMMLRVSDDGIEAKDLSTTNPTRLNGASMTGGFHPMRHEDIIELGKTWFRILLVPEEAEDDSRDIQTKPGDLEHLPSGALPDTRTEEQAAAAPTEVPAEDLLGALAAKAESLFPSVVSALPLPSFELQNCPRCRTKVPVASDRCLSCGYLWPRDRPEAVTQRIDAREMREHLERREKSGRERRKHPRVPLDLPAIYDSESLTFDAIARDISLGGLFLATELLDEVGTECKVTILPDGAEAITCQGVVCRTVEVERRESSRPAGMGLRFTTLSRAAKIWLSSVLMHAQVPSEDTD